MAETISVDYLVVGAGAMGMAFVDELVSGSSKTVAIVDRYARPGGHWTTVYPYVRLHQPSIGYGVNSRRLGEDSVDQAGWNEGLMELASGDEVCAYYSTIMHRTFLTSGRVSYYPQHEYTGEGEFQSLVTGKSYRVGPKTKIVDATYMRVEVPSMRPPPYKVASDVEIIIPNDLPKVKRPYNAYTVIGCGKTGIDACLWLLAQGVEAERIRWIMPRDHWLLARENFQPEGKYLELSKVKSMKQNEVVMAAESVDDLFLKLEESGNLYRFDKNVWPSMFKCATVSLREFDALRGLANIIRKGNVQRVSKDEVILTKGTYKPDQDTLYVDCSANSVPKLEAIPVFNGRHITLQPVRFCQQVFSAAFIGHAELAYGDSEEELKNQLTHPIPHPNVPTDWLRIMRQTNVNGLLHASQPKTAAWLADARLDWFKTFVPKAPEDPEQAKLFMMDLGARLQGVVNKLDTLMGQLPKDDPGMTFTEVARL